MMPPMISDHTYQSNYAGLDPAKQLCTFAHVDAPPCGKPRDKHIHFITHPREISEIVGGELDFEWFDHCEVNLIESTFNDDTVCFAAWTSTKGDEADHNARKGLINRLMKDRHGCYDEKTEVLTAEGWKHWPDVDGSEQFVTLNIETDEIELQHAERLIRKPINERMIHIKMAQVDALITQDHNMFAAPRRHTPDRYELVKAIDFVDRSHRIRMGGGEWNGDLHCPREAALIGFIAADGSYNLNNSGARQVEFHLAKPHKIAWLRNNCSNLTLRFDSAKRAQKYIVNLSGDSLEWTKATYTPDGNRCLPRELLQRADAETLQALLDGFLMGDGNISPTGHITASTVSRQMVDDLQEVALKVGMAATETAPDLKRSGAYGNRPVFTVSIYRDRNITPRVGWTQEAREQQVTFEPYVGNVYCVTVPNGTLYVRRNGKPMWCGNSPFEHMWIQFQVTAPIFVWREHHRHRMASYNEESARYRTMRPRFYIPPRHRPMVQVEGTKAMDYVMAEINDEDYHILTCEIQARSRDSYTSYERLLGNGIVREVARMVLPVNLMSTCIVTMNARALMNFLSLRVKNAGAAYPTNPQWEINRVANEYERHFARLAPLTHQAFVDNGRVAP